MFFFFFFFFNASFCSVQGDTTCHQGSSFKTRPQNETKRRIPIRGEPREACGWLFSARTAIRKWRGSGSQPVHAHYRACDTRLSFRGPCPSLSVNRLRPLWSSSWPQWGELVSVPLPNWGGFRLLRREGHLTFMWPLLTTKLHIPIQASQKKKKKKKRSKIVP